MIIVFGSINMDMILPVARFPEPGETVLGESYEMSPGGKGANQAFAACRIGVKTALVGKVGDDGMGMRIMNGLKRDGVITSGVGQSDKPTGMAVVMRGADGENRIVVSPGANRDVLHDQVPDGILKPGNYVLMQGETPIEQNTALLERAKKNGATTILNLSPVSPAMSMANVDFLVINELEARQLAGGKKADPALIAQAYAEKYKMTCIVTLAAEGAVAVMPDRRTLRVPSLKIEEVVDTTGAGDAWVGTFAAALQSGRTLTDAMRMACVAGSLSCTKKGTQQSYPYLGEIQEGLKRL